MNEQSTGTELLDLVRSLRDTVCPQRQFSLFRFDGFGFALRKRESQWGDLRDLEKGNLPITATDFRAADLDAFGRDFYREIFFAGVAADEREELFYAEEADAFFKHEGFAADLGCIRMEDDLTVLRGQSEDGIARLLYGVTAEHTQQPGQCFFLDDEFHAGRILVGRFSRKQASNGMAGRVAGAVGLSRREAFSFRRCELIDVQLTLSRQFSCVAAFDDVRNDLAVKACRSHRPITSGVGGVAACELGAG